MASFDKYTARFSTPLAGAVAGFLGSRPAARVLDVGCGTGVLSEAVARLKPGSKVLGVDLSEGMLRRAAERAAELGLDRQIGYRLMDAEALDLELRRVFFDQCRSVLACGGRLAYPHGGYVVVATSP